ncbi:syntaxin-7-like [Stegodyphus dumicola]|uniref:syntaxin-7-like n=1 Tax=Stegodyphus dumicola TaxID=202533 RepID=UPI0015AEAD24|nr:syntaxin-7-like [Stegodyphus dumicola]
MAGSYSNGYQYSSYSGPESIPGGQNEFSRLSEVISTNIQKVSQNVASMQKMVNQLGTPQDCESLRSQLHQVQNYTNQLVKDTNNHLKDLSLLPNPASVSDQKQRKILRERLTSQFSDALKNFQGAQRNAAQKERESVMRARAHSGLKGNPFGDDPPASGQNLIDLASPSQSQMMTSLQMEEEVNLELLREREAAVRKLEADIVDVNHIFTDLATLVHEQGEVVDSIEANVEQAQIQVSEGTQQLAKARRHQAAARRKACFLVIVFVLVAAVIGLIIWLSK